MPKTVTFFFLFAVFAFGGCGYSTSSALPSRLKTVHIQAFDNEIPHTADSQRNLYLPLLEVDVRNAVIERFLFDGNLRVAPEDSADLVLSGELIGYNRSALRYDDNNDVLEYRVQISVNLILRDVSKDEVFWVEKGFTGEGDFFVSGPQASAENSAVTRAVEDLARRIVERTIENW